MVAECSRGHLLTPENVRINQRGHRSGCLKCANLSRECRGATSRGRRGRKPQAICKAGHSVTGSNVLIDRKTGHRKGCLACEEARNERRRDERAAKGPSPHEVQRRANAARRELEAAARKAEEEADAEWFDWVAVYRAATGVKEVGRELYPLEIEALIRSTRYLTSPELSDRSGVSVDTIKSWRAKFPAGKSEPVNATEDAPEEADFLAGAFAFSAVVPVLSS